MGIISPPTSGAGAHAVSHQNGGSDEIDATGLNGVGGGGSISQISGTGGGAIFFGATGIDMYSPSAAVDGFDDDGEIHIADDHIYVRNSSGDYGLEVWGSRTELKAQATGSGTGIRFNVGTNNWLWIDAISGKIVLHATSDVPELLDDGDDWQHQSGTGVIKKLAEMEARKGSGTATVASGTTAIVVTHGAGYTPAAQDIDVHPTNNPTNDPGWFWVDTITSTQFTIHVRADPGSGGATFAWRVDR